MVMPVSVNVSLTCVCQEDDGRLDVELTGVRSRDPSSSVALVAASSKSSHRLPYNDAAVGSIENLLRSKLLRLAMSLLRLLSCFAILACVKLLFRGRVCCREWLLCNGATAACLSVGERGSMLGSNPGCS
jgi:hypothetical protein